MCYIGFTSGGIEGKSVWLRKGFTGSRSAIVQGKSARSVPKGQSEI